MGALAGAFIMLCLLGPRMFEPTGPPSCEHVRVIGFHPGRRSQRFIVESVNTPGRYWEVGRFKTQFPPEYRGPLTILVSTGRWTGYDHIKVVQTCSP